MNIGKISNSTTVKALAMGALLCCAIVRCNNARAGYINALKNNVRENVDPQDYQYYENKAKQFGVSEEDVFKMLTIQFNLLIGTISKECRAQAA